MPGKLKCRRVCAVPENKIILPQQSSAETVVLTVEELEAIRLCDLESMEQDDAAASMNVSRATFQRILYRSRAKTADALCSGKAIRIGGGNYELAQRPCGRRGRCRKCCFEHSGKESNNGNKS